MGEVIVFCEVEDRLRDGGSSKEFERSGRDSMALVATEVRGASRLWLRGTCWPVL